MFFFKKVLSLFLKIASDGAVLISVLNYIPYIVAENWENYGFNDGLV